MSHRSSQNLPEPSSQARHWRTFYWVLEWPSALGLGGLAAFLFSLKQVNPEVRFVWNVWSLVVMLVSTGVFWLMLRAIFRPATGEQSGLEPRTGETRGKSRRVRMILFILLLAGGTVGSFLYALRDVSQAKRLDVAVGTGTAFVFVAGAMYGFWRLVRFLEHHGVPEEPTQQEPPPRGGDRKEKP